MATVIPLRSNAFSLIKSTWTIPLPNFASVSSKSNTISFIIDIIILHNFSLYLINDSEIIYVVRNVYSIYSKLIIGSNIENTNTHFHILEECILYQNPLTLLSIFMKSLRERSAGSEGFEGSAMMKFFSSTLNQVRLRSLWFMYKIGIGKSISVPYFSLNAHSIIYACSASAISINRLRKKHCQEAIPTKIEKKDITMRIKGSSTGLKAICHKAAWATKHNEGILHNSELWLVRDSDNTWYSAIRKSIYFVSWIVSFEAVFWICIRFFCSVLFTGWFEIDSVFFHIYSRPSMIIFAMRDIVYD